MSALDVRTAARLLGGKINGRNGVLCPGPNHSPGDESLSVKLDPTAPEGFTVYSHSGDDFKTSRDYVRSRFGLDPNGWKGTTTNVDNIHSCFGDRKQIVNHDNVMIDNTRTDKAKRLWADSRDIHGTVAEVYLKSRGLDLNLVSNIHEVLRFNPWTPWQEDDGTLVYTPCMVACMRSILTDKIIAVQRTKLSPNGVKFGRKMTGVAAGAAIKIDSDSTVEQGIVIAEGLETAMTGMLFGLKPAWALGSAGAIASFPMLPGVDGITILGETGKANAEAVQACGRRWHEAGAWVVIIDPVSGSDINDSVRAVA